MCVNTHLPTSSTPHPTPASKPITGSYLIFAMGLMWKFGSQSGSSLWKSEIKLSWPRSCPTVPKTPTRLTDLGWSNSGKKLWDYFWFHFSFSSLFSLCFLLVVNLTGYWSSELKLTKPNWKIILLWRPAVVGRKKRDWLWDWWNSLVFIELVVCFLLIRCCLQFSLWIYKLPPICIYIVVFFASKSVCAYWYLFKGLRWVFLCFALIFFFT